MTQEYWEVDWAGKGKGNGKGGKGKGGKPAFTGVCYSCGKWGHSARNCPTTGNGFSGVCYICGIQGRSAKYCPGRKVRGKMAQRERTRVRRKRGKGSVQSIDADPEEEEEEEEDESGEIGGLWTVSPCRRSNRAGITLRPPS